MKTLLSFAIIFLAFRSYGTEHSFRIQLANSIHGNPGFSLPSNSSGRATINYFGIIHLDLDTISPLELEKVIETIQKGEYLTDDGLKYNLKGSAIMILFRNYDPGFVLQRLSSEFRAFVDQKMNAVTLIRPEFRPKEEYLKVLFEKNNQLKAQYQPSTSFEIIDGPDAPLICAHLFKKKT